MRLKQCAIWKLHNRKICGHLLRGSAETGLIGQDQLLCHELHPVIQGTDFFGKRFNLLLQAKEHGDKKLLINGIQLFLRVPNCHNRELL